MNENGEQDEVAKRKTLLCWSTFNAAVLAYAAERRTVGGRPKFTRVSKKHAQPWAERRVFELIIKPMVDAMPTKGKTVYPPER